MGLELVGGGGAGDDAQDRAPEEASVGDARRHLAEVRARIGALADRLATLGSELRSLTTPPSDRSGADTGETQPRSGASDAGEAPPQGFRSP